MALIKMLQESSTSKVAAISSDAEDAGRVQSYHRRSDSPRFASPSRLCCAGTLGLPFPRSVEWDPLHDRSIGKHQLIPSDLRACGYQRDAACFAYFVRNDLNSTSSQSLRRRRNWTQRSPSHTIVGPRNSDSRIHRSGIYLRRHRRNAKEKPGFLVLDTAKTHISGGMSGPQNEFRATMFHT